MIAGYPFKYDNIMSSRYNLVIANIKTSSDYSDINGSMEYTTLNLPVNNKIMLLGKDLKEAYSFDMEVISENSNVALSLKQQKSIVNWLFEREYHKLEIISEEYKDIYFNCYLTQPKKIVAGCGVIGYSCKAVCDGLGAWENTKTKSFYQHQVNSYNDSDIHFSMPYSGKMDISVDGNTTEILNGIKTSTNQSTLKGVSKVIDSTDGLSQEFPIGQELNRIDSDTYDTADLKAGKITLNTEVKRLLGDNDWEYTEDSVNTVSGTNLHITDAQSNEHFISFKVNGKTNQTVTHQGKNLFDGVLQQGAWTYADGHFTGQNATYLSNKNKINVLGGNVYTLSFSTTKNVLCGFVFYNNGIYVNSGGGETSQKTFTVPSNANQIGFNLHCPDGLNSSDVSQIQLELGSTATAYVPFVPESPSVDYPAPITGVTKITVNGMDYALPRTLYDEDCYDIIKGQGQAKQNLITLDGSHQIVYLNRETDSIISFTFSIPLKGKKGSVPRCDKFAYSITKMGVSIDVGGNVYFAKIPNTLIGVAYTDTDDQVKTKILNYFADNPVTVLYELATPQAITGTPVSIITTSDMTMTTDNGGDISANYINNSNVLYVRHPYSLQKIGLCNRFNYVTMDSNWSKQEEAITIYQNYMYIKIFKTVASNIDDFNTWLNSTSVLYISPLLIPNVINVSPTIATYYNGTNHLTTDANGVIHVSLYNNISHNVFVNTSDYNEYMIPSLTTITCGTVGGNISVQNTDDVNSNQITFTGLSPNEIITIDEFGQMQSSTGLNRYDNWNGKRLHLISGDNHINISGDVVRLDISYQNVRRIGI